METFIFFCLLSGTLFQMMSGVYKDRMINCVNDAEEKSSKALTCFNTVVMRGHKY